MEHTHDLIVIGGGPAGMSAALTAADQGLKTLLIDEQPRPGGQIYRNVTANTPTVAALLGPDYRHGLDLAGRLDQSTVTRHFGTLVWDVAPDLTLSCDQGGRSFQVRAPQLIAASGAMERASPVPGWTLPGVMNAGAAQIALKGSGVVPAGPVVLAGSGPLLLLVACQLLDAQVPVDAVVQTAPRANQRRALRHLLPALGAPAMLMKGLRMLARLRAAGVPMFAAATDLRVEGSSRASALSFSAGGRRHVIDAEVVLLHHGVIPNTQMTRMLRVAHAWNEVQLAWQPETDAYGQTSLPGFRVAGDGAGIVGALGSEAQGALAALGAAADLGKVSTARRDELAAPWRDRLNRQLRIRPFLDALYRPPAWLAEPADDTIVCRCEEVTAGRVREMARLGCLGPNQTKFFSRCGMGPCQGRTCGTPVTQLLASTLAKTPEAVGAYRIRPPLKPVPLASIAGMTSGAPITSNDTGKHP